MNQSYLALALSRLLLLIATIGLFNPSLKACDRSSYVLDSLTFDGAEFTIYTQFCIGGGLLGSNRGADNFTSTFAFALYGPTTMQMTSFSPATFTSDTTLCPANSFGFSGGVGINADTGVAYIPGCFYTCISSTAQCGRPHSDCNQMVVSVNELPDSIRLFGIEGAGNPIAGCYPNPDMIIDFTTLPVVWSSFYAVPHPEEVVLNWSTAQETNNDYFKVFRSGVDQVWEEIGRTNAVGYSESIQEYNFVDDNPLLGTNWYKIEQIDLDGARTTSEAVSADFAGSFDFDWESVGPNPVQEQLNIGYQLPESQSVKLALFDTQGRLVFSDDLDGQAGVNRISLDFSVLPRGNYFLKLVGKQGALHKQITRM